MSERFQITENRPNQKEWFWRFVDSHPLMFIVLLVCTTVSVTFIMLLLFFGPVSSSSMTARHSKQVESAAFSFLNPYFKHKSSREKCSKYSNISYSSNLGYSINRFRGSWISDTETAEMEGNKLVSFDYVTNTKKILLNISDQVVDDFKISPDSDFVLIQSGSHKNFRYSQLAYYFVYDLKTLKKTAVSKQKLQLCEWMSSGNGIVFVYENNIYYKSSVESDPVSITKTGLWNTVFNGVADWVYEEEIFGSSKAVWSSPANRYIAFISFNDTLVPIMSLPHYATTPPNIPKIFRQTNSSGSVIIAGAPSQYPTYFQLRYPKPGHHNPSVHLLVHDTERNHTFNLPHAELVSEAKIFSIQTHFVWLNDTAFLSIRQNRLQNHAKMIACNLQWNATVDLYCITVKFLREKNGWLEIPQSIKPINNGSEVIMILYREVLDNTRLPQIVRIPIEKDAKIIDVSHQLNSIKEIVDVQETDDFIFIYFTMAAFENPGTQLSQVIKYNGQDIETVSVSDAIEECSYSNMELSKAYKFVLLHCDGPIMPEDFILTWYQRAPRVVHELTNNMAAALHQNRKIPMPMYDIFDVEIEGENRARIRLYKPQGADVSGNTKYPLIVNVYGGPSSQAVNNAFKINFNIEMVVKRNILVAEIDGRGTINQGDKFLYSVYTKLGQNEIFDQINMTRYLHENVPFIDTNRTAIWGWSYGGYSTLMAMIQDHDNLFSCGAAVAPVTDWHFYDSIYTERYLGLPNDVNDETGEFNYVTASVLEQLSNITSNKFVFSDKKKLFLAHGTFDDNVHYQQMIHLINLLEVSEIPYELHTYPDERHSLLHVRSQLYNAIDRFFMKCFDLTENC